MNDALEGRTIRRIVDHFVLWFGALAVVAAIALFVTGRWPDAVGALLSPFPIGAMAVRVIRTLRDVIPKNRPPTGMSIMAATTAMPGVILLMVGNLIGGDIVVISGTATGATLIGL